MEVVVRPSPVTTTATAPAIKPISCLALGRNTHFLFYSLPPSFPGKITHNLRKSVIAAAKKKKKKEDDHSHVAKPDEATGPFPEAVLLKEKKVQGDGRLLPEFADDEEQELFELLNLELESELDVDRMRHYEVVYLIHEDRAKEVENVNTKVEDFIKEKKGRIWRFSDWGLRRLAYKIQKAKYAHYVLMNFELPANWINDFKTMLDKDERVIRHLVMKRDKAETEDCPPPPEFHTIYAGTDDEEEDDFHDEDEIDMDETGDDNEEGVIYVDDYIEKDSEIGEYEKSSSVNDRGRRKLKPEKVGR